MIVYEGTKEDFLKSVEADTIALEIEETIYERTSRRTARSEFRSWENSMQYMYKVLNDDGIPGDAGIAIEYIIPQTSKRIDFLITGYDQEQVGNAVIIELKQWDALEAVEGHEALVETYVGRGKHRVVHPSYQAWSYSMLLKDYNQSVQENRIVLSPCAYLHNYRRHQPDPLDAPQYAPFMEEAPAFTRGEVEKLRCFIRSCVKKGDQKELLYSIEHGRIRPSKSLQDVIGSMLKGNREFTMIDEQKVVYEEILNVSRKCMEDGKKRVFIVRGGPGTGKTVVAVNLLAQMTMEDQFCQYVSKNTAPREVYSKKLKGNMKKSSIDNLFKGSGIFVQAPENGLDTVIVDEAHRLNEKSGLYRNQGENQVKEIIHAARCSVFFIDERQRVTIYDIGRVEEIERWAEQAGAEVFYGELASQFRCGGSQGYLAWLDDVLDIRATANFDLTGIDYDIQVVDSPNRLRDIVIEKNRMSNRARILAGYCWNWIKASRNDTDVHDIKIGDFEISWNLSNTTFAIDEASVNEAGCIHTSQGLEFDYVGVIIGEDMRYENGRIVTDFTKRAATDDSLRGIKKINRQDPHRAAEIADEIIKNTYRTLMTRGMKGCYVYCVDPRLAEYLKERIRRNE